MAIIAVDPVNCGQGGVFVAGSELWVEDSVIETVIGFLGSFGALVSGVSEDVNLGSVGLWP